MSKTRNVLTNTFKSNFIKTTVLDTNSKYLGIPIIELMKNSGKAIAKELIKKYGRDAKFAFICGLGNNGGDGLATAKKLSKKGIKSTVYLLGAEQEILTEEAKEIFQDNKNDKNIRTITSATEKDIKKADVFIECVIGTGIRGKLKTSVTKINKKVNSFGTKKVAIDVPIPGYKPNLTICLDYPKTNDCVVVDIGVPKKAKRHAGPGDVKALWEPKPDSIKYQNGEILIYAGSRKFHGAPLMAIQAASKLVGSVFYYTSLENQEIAKHLKLEIPEFIALTDNDLEKYAEYANTLLCGPGLEANLPTKSIIKGLIKKFKDKTAIIDAYAITVAKDKEKLLKDNIITPHVGELRHFFPEGEIPENKREIEKRLRDFAIQNKCYIFLTGKTDILFHKNGEIAYNEIGNQGMAKGGTGDVLVGIMAGLLAKNSPWLAMRAAAFINGMAGENLYQKYGYNYSATDLIDEIRHVIKWCKEY